MVEARILKLVELMEVKMESYRVEKCHADHGFDELYRGRVPRASILDT
jgi:hypothetical protein